MWEAQTKDRTNPPLCGEEVNALDLGAAMPPVTLWVKATSYHGWPLDPSNCDMRREYFWCVDLYVRALENVI